MEKTNNASVAGPSSEILTSIQSIPRQSNASEPDTFDATIVSDAERDDRIENSLNEEREFGGVRYE